MTNLVLVEKQGYVATLFMNRPEKRNSVNPELLLELAEKLKALQEGGEVRAVVLRGVGEEAFSSGYDIGRIDTTGAGRGADRNQFDYTIRDIIHFPFPVIAMIYGYCVGGGLELAVSCDLRIAADNAKLGITPAKLGLVYRPEGLVRFINTVGIGHTKELFFTGRIYDALRAKEMGLVDYVVPQRELSAFTYDLAAEIGANAPLSLSGIKGVINHALHFQRISEEDRAAVKELIRRAAQSEDLKEGQRAFLEKRKPLFQGR